MPQPEEFIWLQDAYVENEYTGLIGRGRAGWGWEG